MTMFDPRIAVVALAVSGAGLLGLGAFRAHAHGGFGGHRDHAMVHKFIEFAVDQKLTEIGATDTQKQKVREVTERLMREGKALHESRGTLHDQLIGLLEKDEVDAAQVKALVRERTDAVARFGDEAAEALVELHGVFTPEQRSQLLAHAREHAALRRH
jgi:Spy/CpxP family protein refolding chaperone